MEDELLTIEQTAVYLKVSDKTIRRLISYKQLIASKVGGSWRIKKSNVEIYLENNENIKKGGK